MKHTNKFTYILLALTACLYFTSCKKETTDTGTNNNTTAKGTLKFHTHTYFGQNEVEYYDSIFTFSGGRKIAISKAQLYLSKIELIKADGSIVTVPGKILFKSKEVEVQEIGNVPSDVPAGNYKGLSFYIGLDHATNLMNPGSSASDPLNQPSMWFGTTAQPEGYIYLNFQGKIDTTAAGNGSISQMQPFVYKIGTDKHYSRITTLNTNFSILPDQENYIHMKLDYSMLFMGIGYQFNNPANLKVENVADNSGLLSDKIYSHAISMLVSMH